MNKAVLMYCCRSAGNTSDKSRALRLAHQLSDEFNVTIVLENRFLDALEIPSGVACVTLPAFDVDPGSDEFDISALPDLRDRLISRRDTLLETFERLKPRICLVESFPFEMHRLRGEVLPLVERARNGVYGESLVVALTDGILGAPEADSERDADEAGRILNRYFDLVLVRSDPVFARLEEFFRPKNAIDIPTYHVGFMSRVERGPAPAHAPGENQLLVSAGDGRHGGRLFRAAVEAHKILWPVNPIHVRIITGERLPDDDWQVLLRNAADAPSVSISRSSADFRRDIELASWSISQCSYDTAVDVLSTDTPSLFVPSTAPGKADQLARAQRLVYWGRGRLMPERLVNGASLATEINELASLNVRPATFDLNGAMTAASLLGEVVYNNRYPTTGSGRFNDRPRPV